MQKHERVDKVTEEIDLSDLVVDAIQDKKGEGVVKLDMREVSDAVTDNFVICHATTTVQVKAIADHVVDKINNNFAENPWHKEGFGNLEWVLLDYVNVVVHVFLKSKREFYHLEDLWSDAVRTDFEDA